MIVNSGRREGRGVRGEGPEAAYAQDYSGLLAIPPVYAGLRAGITWISRNGSRPSGLAIGADIIFGWSEGLTLSFDHLRQSDSNVTELTLSALDAHIKSYASFGGGIYHVRASKARGGSDHVTGFGFKLTFGRLMPDHYYVQADYHLPLTPKIDGFQGNGLVVAFGVFL